MGPDESHGGRRRPGLQAHHCPIVTVGLFCGALLIGTSLGTPGSHATAPLISIEITVPTGDPVDRPLTQPALDRQIERILENPEFSWREPAADSANEKSLLDRLVSWMRETILSIGDALNRLWKTLRKIFDFKHYFAEPPTSESQFPTGIANVLTYLLWATFAGALILFAIRLRRFKTTMHPKPVGPPPAPDLADDGVAANQLPDDQWSALARQRIAAGEFRQALRAFFLAILALLASQRFIAIERWKSNSDYENELRRKAKPRSDLLSLFSQSRLGFERCWYGADSITPEALENYSDLYERIKHAATDNR